MNELTIVSSHKAFKDCSLNESICFSYKNIKIQLSYNNQQLHILLKSRKKRKKTVMIFHELFNLLFLILGGFPEIKCASWNAEPFHISDLDKYNTSIHFLNSNFQIADISTSNINEETLSKLDAIYKKPLYSIQYLVCKQYEKVITDHKTALLMHTVDGFVNRYEKVYIENVKLALDPFFKYHRKHNCGILKALNTTSKKLCETIRDTRHATSHFSDKDLILEDGEPYSIYFFLLYFSLRAFLLENIIKIKLSEEKIRECLYVYHDWIVEIKKRKAPFKSITYKLVSFQKDMYEITRHISAENPIE